MDLKIKVGKLFMSSVYDYEFGAFKVNAFFAECESPEISKLCEHEQYKWVTPNEMLSYKFSPADVPIVKVYAASIK